MLLSPGDRLGPYDILAPINVYRPGEMSDSKTRFEIEKLADPKVSLDDIKKMLEKRLDGGMLFRLRPGGRVNRQHQKLALGDDSRERMQQLHPGRQG